LNFLPLCGSYIFPPTHLLSEAL